MKYGLPDAEVAEISQKAQKGHLKNFSCLFCGLCMTFATSASGSPIPYGVMET